MGKFRKQAPYTHTQLDSYQVSVNDFEAKRQLFASDLRICLANLRDRKRGTEQARRNKPKLHSIVTKKKTKHHQ